MLWTGSLELANLIPRPFQRGKGPGLRARISVFAGGRNVEGGAWTLSREK